MPITTEVSVIKAPGHVVLFAPQFDEKVNELDEEVSKMKKANEELKKRTKKAQVNAEKFEHQNKTLQNKVVNVRLKSTLIKEINNTKGAHVISSV